MIKKVTPAPEPKLQFSTSVLGHSQHMGNLSQLGQSEGTMQSDTVSSTGVMRQYFQFQNENTRSWDNTLNVIMEKEPYEKIPDHQPQVELKSFSTTSEEISSHSLDSSKEQAEQIAKTAQALDLNFAPKQAYLPFDLSHLSNIQDVSKRQAIILEKNPYVQRYLVQQIQ